MVMRKLFYIGYVAVLAYFGLSLCGNGPDNLPAHEHPYDIVLVTLSRGKVAVIRCLTAETPKKTEHIFSVDLADTQELYDTVTCSKDHRNCIVVRSGRKVICDYIINWATMVGIDGAYIASAIPLDATLMEQGPNSTLIKINGTSDHVIGNLELMVDQPIKSICVFALPRTLLDTMYVTQKTMSFADGCKLGIITTQIQHECICEKADLLEIEFEQMIDSMLKDGTIKINRVGPIMAFLRNIGSIIFMKYIAVKQALTSRLHDLLHRNEPQTGKSSKQVQ
jgi:hypothetical protein